MKIEKKGKRTTKKEMKYSILSLLYISGIAPVKMPTTKIMRKIANAAGNDEITRGKMSFTDLRSDLSVLMNFLRLKINQTSPAVGSVNKRNKIR